MMDKLCIEMIFANTSQTKGLIERYNGTVQRRLPNDIIRFKIKDYDQFNVDPVSRTINKKVLKFE